jgi:hypothetical protein
MPGAMATRTSGHQLQVSVSSVGFAVAERAAQRPQRVAVRNFASSVFGIPPGTSSQPWSVTTRTCFQPASIKKRTCSTTVSRITGTSLASRRPCSWP